MKIKKHITIFGLKDYILYQLFFTISFLVSTPFIMFHLIISLLELLAEIVPEGIVLMPKWLRIRINEKAEEHRKNGCGN